MAGRRALRPAGELIAPAVAEMVTALDPPPEDAPMVALARSLAATIDAMPEGVRVAMLPQHTGQLVRVLKELDDRARKRGQRPAGPPSKLDRLRAARAHGRRA